MNRSTITTLLVVAAIFAVATPQLFSNPTGGIVTHGNALISENGTTLSVEQLSDKAIIHWDSFSISAGELTRFIQPGKNSAALNRVVTGNPSALHGQLQSNGKVILINQNGILIGPSGRIEAGGGFVASTLDLPDSEFISGGDLTFSGNSLAAVSNLGTIVAAEGDVILLAAGDVSNSGTINAPNGTAALATGTQVLVKSSGDERILVQAGSTKGKVDHSGTIRAAQAELKALGGAEQLAVNVSGLIEATGVQKSDGRILLTAGKGAISVSGKIKAKTASGDGGFVKIDSETKTRLTGEIDAASDSGIGGRIEITGGSVILDDAALVDASGSEGGEVFVGGGFQGADEDLRNAKKTTIGSGVFLKANASGFGDAGQVIVWADDITFFGGHVSVEAENGDAGFVEISGKDQLFYRGTVDLKSETGSDGTLLLDPLNVNIVVGAAGAAANSAEIADGVILDTDGGATDFTITTGDITALGGNVLIQADNDITAAAGADIVGGGEISFTAGNDVSLNNVDANGQVIVVAGNNLSFNTIDTSATSPGVDGGNVTIIFGNEVAGGNIIANGADGAAPGQDGGNGGSVAIFDIVGGNVIGVNEIQNAGGNGADGDSANPGGNGGDGGFVSVGNGTTPSSSITIPNIIYGGGDGGDGNPPGSGGQGGSLFVNNATAVPNNTAPGGQNGTNLAPSNSGNANNNGAGNEIAPFLLDANEILDNFEPPSVISGPGFSSELGGTTDLGIFSQENQLEGFGTGSLTDWGAQSGGNTPGATHPYGQTDFGFNNGQFPVREAAIFDSTTGMPLRSFEEMYCYFFYGFYDCEYFDFFVKDELNADANVDFFDQVGAINDADLPPTEDRTTIFGSSLFPPRTQTGEVPVAFTAKPKGPSGKGRNVKGRKGGKSDKSSKGGKGRNERFDEPELDEFQDEAPSGSSVPGNSTATATGSTSGLFGQLFAQIKNVATGEVDNEQPAGRAAAILGGQAAMPVVEELPVNPPLNGGRNPNRNNGNSPALNRAIDERNQAREEAKEAEQVLEDAKNEEDEAKENARRKRDELKEAENERGKNEEELAAKKKKLDQINVMLRNLLDGAEDFREDAEARRAFREQVLRLDAEARALRAEVNEAQADFDNAERQVAKANLEVGAADRALENRKNESEEANRELNKAERDLNREENKVAEGIKDRNKQEEAKRRIQDAINRRREDAAKRKKAEELAKAEAAIKKEQDRINKVRNERKQRLAEAKRTKGKDAGTLNIDANEIDFRDNAAEAVQKELENSQEISRLEGGTTRKRAENPFDAPDARIFDGPLITQLFEQKEAFEENERVVTNDEDFEISTRDFVDFDPDLDFFQETEVSADGQTIQVTQTAVDRSTGEFTTTVEEFQNNDLSAIADRPFGQTLRQRLNQARAQANGDQPDSNPQLKSFITGKITPEKPAN